jgi:DNA-binding NtrC family response regulator
VERDTAEPGPSVASAEVLVVDDDPTVSEVVAEALSDRGHVVRCASSAAEALGLLGERVADLVVTDLAMPDVNGLALADMVRARWPEARIVLMSGADVESLTNLPDDVAVDMTIAKPFQIDELCYVVESALAPVGWRQERG